MKRLTANFLGCILTLSFFAAGASAEHLTKRQCLKDVNSAMRAAIKTAHEEAKFSRLICEAGTEAKAACLQSCLQARNECVKPLNVALKACFDAADLVFADGRAGCKSSTSCTGHCGGNTDFQQCMVPLRVALYQANRACKLADDSASRKACRTTYHDCNKTCKAS